MTQDEIIELARQADLVVWRANSTFSDGIWWIDAHEPNEELKSFAQLVAAKEREACNAICKEAYEWAESRRERDGSDPHFSGRMRAAQDIGQAIRARGEA